jgi:hypothetical protein
MMESKKVFAEQMRRVLEIGLQMEEAEAMRENSNRSTRAPFNRTMRGRLYKYVNPVGEAQIYVERIDELKRAKAVLSVGSDVRRA